MDVNTSNTHALRQNAGRRKCYRCGSEGHLANVCRHKETICHNCSVKGHLAKVCRRREENTQLNSARSAENETDGEHNIYYVYKLASKEPLKVKINVNAVPVDFEIDTGSGLTILSDKFYRKYFYNRQLEKANVVIKTYNNEQLNVLGKLIATVEYNNKKYNELNVYVVKGDGVNLLGRDWLSIIDLKWDDIVTSNHSLNKFTSTNKTTT